MANPLLTMAAPVFNPVMGSLITGSPVTGPPGSAPAPTTQSLNPPPGIHVTGFTKGTSIKPSFFPTIDHSLLAAVAMARVVVERMQHLGSTDVEYLRFFKTPKYFGVVLSVFEKISQLLPLVPGNVTIQKIIGASHPDGSKGAFIEASLEIELFEGYWSSISGNLPANGLPTGAAYQQFLTRSPKGLSGIEAVYESRATVLLHEMMHLVSCDMPAFETVTDTAHTIDPTFEGGHIVDVSFGTFFFPTKDDAVFARIQDPPLADLPAGVTADQFKRAGKAYGIVMTQFLAQLGLGDLAAVLNADSYTVFAAGCYDAACAQLGPDQQLV